MQKIDVDREIVVITMIKRSNYCCAYHWSVYLDVIVKPKLGPETKYMFIKVSWNNLFYTIYFYIISMYVLYFRCVCMHIYKYILYMIIYLYLSIYTITQNI